MAGDRTLKETTFDVVVVGSGAGGMTAALAANKRGLDTVVIEKGEFYGGSTALSGGGIWAPGAKAMTRRGHVPDPAGVFTYLKTITDGLVSDERLRAYVDSAPAMMDELESVSNWLEFVWKPGYPDYYPDLPGGSAVGATMNVNPIDLRKLGDLRDELIPPLALAPKGIYLGPLELRDFYRIRQSYKGKLVLLRLLWRMVKARVTGEQIVAIGQALVARLRLAMRDQGIPLWLNSPMTGLVVDDGRIVGVEIERDGHPETIYARGGVIIASGGFDHNMPMRQRYQPTIAQDWSMGNRYAEGDGIEAAQKTGAAVDLMDEAWWFPAIEWPDGRLQFMLNERMIPGQFIVNGAGERFVNEAAPYTDFGHAVIEGQRSGTTHIPSWLIIDSRSWRKYLFAGHLPLPKIPFAPVPTGTKPPKAWLETDVVQSASTWPELARKIGVPVEALNRTADRFNNFARAGVDSDFHRGESAYDNYYGDVTLSNPNLAPLESPPFYAFKIVPGDLGTNGGILTDERGRALDETGNPIEGLYATGNVAASVMGRSYAGAGATIGPAMTFGYIAAKHIAATADTHPHKAAKSAADRLDEKKRKDIGREHHRTAVEHPRN
ncbi:FAD-binding protein [Hoyosella subflava]|uniref:3-oxosteroid 1-dehydrogenase n=1 Tax=Hoyosella subflava (strain DSM 45089 / JCM 17490 / NBRC 109087 / DQS3-9A1) TaxID=443218 RepID=F6EEG8_HOYSD|nr:FAD-binding protein [Hoyosella subflava]AEF38620.1 3-ketosteroid dehydrogenase [Hoyosella subflava DQS3-9A1]